MVSVTRSIFVRNESTILSPVPDYMPLVSLDGIGLAFGHLPLLDQVNLQIEPRERICVIGRNGTGKSTLLQIISGEQAPDAGSVWTRPGLRVARLVQDVPLST